MQNKQSFKKLQNQWYKKLKQQGFKDVEDTNSSKEFLKDWHSNYFQIRHDPLRFESTQEYYRLCGHFLHEHKFKSKKQKAIWAYHAQGESIRHIAKLLSLKIWFVHKTVQALQSLVRCNLQTN